MKSTMIFDRPEAGMRRNDRLERPAVGFSHRMPKALTRARESGERLGKREYRLRVHEFRRDLLLAQAFERGAVERAEDRRDGRLALEPLALRLSDALGDSLRDSGLDERQMRQDLLDAPGDRESHTWRIFRR